MSACPPCGLTVTWARQPGARRDPSYSVTTDPLSSGPLEEDRSKRAAGIPASYQATTAATAATPAPLVNVALAAPSGVATWVPG